MGERRVADDRVALGGILYGTEYTPSEEASQVAGKAQYQQAAAQGADAASRREQERVQGATIDAGAQGEFRGQQQRLGSTLWDAIQGRGPSVAQTQLQKSTEDAQRAAMSLAASNPSLTPAQAQQMAQRGMTQAQMQGAQQLAQLRAQEQVQARGELGGLVSGARGQDIGLATSQAGLTQQAALANQQAAMQQQAQNDAMVQYYTSQGLSIDMAEMAARNQLEQIQAGAGTSGGAAAILGGLGSGLGEAGGKALFS